MTYQALARKWRPSRFDEVVGQEHVVNALTHALDDNRVHHAFLFTGTRGVGKTTLARLLAKSLNCERGMSSRPCGECGTCVSVDEGRFIDLLEVDAASRTKVDDTRELLDNVQYAPTVGAYKVYLIDEVHMLSGHSFNALLKTLEEPPPHVKFLLATTDPQKLPVTVLSRCLQFNLRALTQHEILGQLERILEKEEIVAEKTGLSLLARSASGSMRDGLSLLDQSIAFSGGEVTEERVRRMLGMIDDHHVLDLLEGLLSQSPLSIFRLVDHMRARSLDFSRALDDLLTALHEIALLQKAPELTAEREMTWANVHHLVNTIPSEVVQLFYQIALIGKRDLPLASDAAQGFEMVLLRMLAFKPAGNDDAKEIKSHIPDKKNNVSNRLDDKNTPAVENHQSLKNSFSNEVPHSSQNLNPAPATVSSEIKSATNESGEIDSESWGHFVENTNLKGLVRELAMNLSFSHLSKNKMILNLSESVGHLYSNVRHQALDAMVKEHFGSQYSIDTQKVTSVTSDTPALKREEQLAREKNDAIEGFKNDTVIKDFVEKFDAEVLNDSIQPEKHKGS